MPRGSPHGGSDAGRAVAREVIAAIGADGAAAEIRTSLTAFCAAVAATGWTAAVTGLTAAAAPIGAYVLMLGTAVYCQWKAGKRSEQELREHFAELAEALRLIESSQSEAEEMLTAIYSRSRFVWARLDGHDKDVIAQRTKEAMRPLLKELGLTGMVDLDDLWIVGIDTNERVRSVESNQAEMLSEVRGLRALLEQSLDQKTLPPPGEPDAPPPVSPEAVAAAQEQARSPEASLLDRVNAAVLQGSPEALELLDRLDHLTEAADYTRHQRRGDYHYSRGEYDAAVEPYEKALALRPDDFTARNNVLLSHARTRLGSIEGHRRRAIEIAQGTLVRTSTHAFDWAMTQSILGNVYSGLPTGDRGENLRRAIRAYESALEVYSRNAHPVEWAATQNNLGNAYGGLPTGDRGENLRCAIEAYESALEVYSRNAHPADWAATQNNLGNAYSGLPTGDRWANLARAIGAYESALEVYTREAHPVDWATTQNNLGTIYQNLPTGDHGANLRRAIGAYESALEVRTREALPFDWAMTQSNLGSAYSDLPTGDRRENLERAIGAFESALEVRAREVHPVGWAMTHFNLALALSELSKLSEKELCPLLRRAVSSAKSALHVWTADAFPHDHGEGQRLQSWLRSVYESCGCAATVPFDDIPPAA